MQLVYAYYKQKNAAHKDYMNRCSMSYREHRFGVLTLISDPLFRCAALHCCTPAVSAVSVHTHSSVPLFSPSDSRHMGQTPPPPTTPTVLLCVCLFALSHSTDTKASWTRHGDPSRLVEQGPHCCVCARSRTTSLVCMSVWHFIGKGRGEIGKEFRPNQAHQPNNPTVGQHFTRN